MLKSKVFIKRNRRGNLMKIVREHYLRDDITCGCKSCTLCKHKSYLKPCLGDVADCRSCLFTDPHYILPDTNVILHQVDVLEDAAITNVIILQTVFEEVKHRSIPVFKRVKDIISNPDKQFYLFPNEFNKDTYVEREPGESSNDRNDRAIRRAAKWYGDHLSSVDIILITGDSDNKVKASADGISACTVHEYVESLKNNGALMDKLANPLLRIIHSGEKVLFPEHLFLSQIQRGIKSCRYYQGQFLASRDNYLEGNVSVESLDDMIFLQGLVNMNRAVDGDIVAVEMFPESEWSAPSSLVLTDSGDTVEEDDDEEKDSADGSRNGVVPLELRQPTGKVVGIIKRRWRHYCGILQPSLLTEATRHLVTPAERKIPRIRIETRQSNSLAGKRIVVAIDSWPRSSRYPLGHFVRSLGNVGDKDTENEVLLLEHDVPRSRFSRAVLDCLPSLPWSIPPEEEEKRSDFRSLNICSVDPPGCTDIDDALHCRRLDNGHLEVGVHIADVSYFICPGTALDREAANRGNTVYLIDQRIDMVPDLLSSNLCSLRSDVDRLAFSVLWEMTEDAMVIGEPRFTKSVIRSKASLTYAEAQLRIDDPKMTDCVTESLRNLNKLAKIFKRRRIDNGALSLASTEVRFHVDSETHDPIDVQLKELRDTNSLVEEFMLLANVTAAHRMHKEFPHCACLRRHPAPPPSNYDPIVKAAMSKNIKLDISSGKALSDSLDGAEFPDNPFFNTMLRIMTTRCMMQAIYFCSGLVPEQQFFHYGLAAPIYTHFTSPIRRYSDVIVHRLLAASVGADVTYPDLLDKHKTQVLCNNLNYRHKMAQYAGRASVSLHTHLFFKTRTQEEDGYVLFVRKNALQILIPKYGLEATLFLCSQDKSVGGLFSYNERKNTQTSVDGVVIGVFDPVTVQLSIDRSNVQHLKLRLHLVQPQVPGFSVPPVTCGQEKGPPSKKSKSLDATVQEK